MNIFLTCFIAGATFLLAFLLFFHPLQQNIKANRWLAAFVLIMGAAFVSTYLIASGGAYILNGLLLKCLNSVQFLLGPALFISILYFVKPARGFLAKDWLHFIPFIIYTVVEITGANEKESISTLSLFDINKNVSFLIRDLLPFQTLFYLIKSYLVLIKHRKKMELISSNTNQVNLDWLVQFVFMLLLTVIIWINDALFELPGLTQATLFIYTIAVFFLAWFSIKQKTIFAFKEKDIKAIYAIIEPDNRNLQETVTQDAVETSSNIASPHNVTAGAAAAKPKPKRLQAADVITLTARLSLLMENERLFLENELTLPAVAEKLGISIHDASYLINETTGQNFYNFINKYRVAEAKKLLASATIEELNILGIAYAAGFNSKTTFNTTFKKLVGVSPSQYSKEQKNTPK
ncbi:MAG: helix-turn-helix transcriptional regulator [Rhizobacter sp.]|nr:helix-turn-helix transcriptional regulator [Ferruginibacter sp.]